MIKGQAQRDLKMKTALRKENNKKYISSKRQKVQRLRRQRKKGKRKEKN